jgi:hypothetical protein
MKVEPHIMRGPDFDGCLDYCEHPKTIGQYAIYWQTDDGQEWGTAVAVALREGKIPRRSYLTLEAALWSKYMDWEDLNLNESQD